jgi:hypothetical protein
MNTLEQVIDVTTFPLDEIDLGFVVRLDVFKQIINGLNSKHNRWWISTEPLETIECGYLLIGHSSAATRGQRDATDAVVCEAEAVYFRIPVLNTQVPRGGSRHLLLLIHPFAIVPPKAEYFRENGGTLGDLMRNLHSCFPPIKAAMIRMLECASVEADEAV